VLDGVTGHVVDGRDVAAVADRIAALLADPATASAMGGAGRSWVERDWRWEAVAARLTAFLAG
jgi:phosphatidylinositol alpha-1,6-mannosyltransferase